MVEASADLGLLILTREELRRPLKKSPLGRLFNFPVTRMIYGRIDGKHALVNIPVATPLQRDRLLDMFGEMLDEL
ncbi:hypothetical protein IT407_03675 [Candidatus Uhrbacteria bacterium]|nr:hypothetical protein [Candidatus Uhrbacteria bacterium]